MAGKESACNAGDPSLIPGSGRSAGEGNGYPLQYYGLENSVDSVVHGVAKSRTRLSGFHVHLGKARTDFMADGELDQCCEVQENCSN